MQKLLIAMVALEKGVLMPEPNESSMLQAIEMATGEAVVDITLMGMLVARPGKVSGNLELGDR